MYTVAKFKDSLKENLNFMRENRVKTGLKSKHE